MCGGGNGFSSKSLPDRSNTFNVSLAAAANIPQSIHDTLADGINKLTVLFGMDEKKSRPKFGGGSTEVLVDVLPRAEVAAEQSMAASGSVDDVGVIVVVHRHLLQESVMC